MNKNLLNKAIKHFGTQAALARALGCSRQNICNIKRGVPASIKLEEKIKVLLQNEQTIISMETLL